jgi:hypothetical protein
MRQGGNVERISLFDHYQTMGREGIIFQFKGSMSQALLVKFGDMIREDLFPGPPPSGTIDKATLAAVMASGGGQPPASKKGAEIRTVFSVFVELAQNINRYSAERADADLESNAGCGIVVVSESEDRYTVASGNKIENKRLGWVVDRLKAMESLPPEMIRKLYREQLKSAPPEGSVGAGLGFYDIAKRSGGGLRYSVHPMEGDFSFLELFVDIKKGAENG